MPPRAPETDAIKRPHAGCCHHLSGRSGLELRTRRWARRWGSGNNHDRFIIGLHRVLCIGITVHSASPAGLCQKHKGIRNCSETESIVTGSWKQVLRALPEAQVLLLFAFALLGLALLLNLLMSLEAQLK